MPSISYCVHELDKCGFRKICTTIKWLCIRCEEHSHWPAATTGHGLDGVHINRVDVWSLFTIDFDVDEQLIHERSSFDIFKTLVGHDMTPVARRISNREKYWLTGCAGESKSILSPRIPINWVFAMLAKVRADLVTEAIGHVYEMVMTEVNPSVG